MNAQILDNMNYSGIANIKLNINGKIIKKKIHNNGTMQLKRAFAMFMCGGKTATDALRYIPSRLDLRSCNVGASGPYLTCLKRPVLVTNPTYQRDNLNSWAVEYNAVIPYSDLISSISSGLQYRVYLMCDSSAVQIDDDSNDIAYIDIKAEDLESMSAGVSLIIAWKLKLLNKGEDITNG